MSQIKGKDNIPVILLRKHLWSQGCRYRLHYTNLASKPDIVFANYNNIIFVHGCYGHQDKKYRDGRIITSNTIFGVEKLAKKIARDKRNNSFLKKAECIVLVVWAFAIEIKLEKIGLKEIFSNE